VGGVPLYLHYRNRFRLEVEAELGTPRKAFAIRITCKSGKGEIQSVTIVYGNDVIYKTKADPPGLSVPYKIASDECLAVTLRPAGAKAGGRFDHDPSKGDLKVLVVAGANVLAPRYRSRRTFDLPVLSEEVDLPKAGAAAHSGGSAHSYAGQSGHLSDMRQPSRSVAGQVSRTVPRGRQVPGRAGQGATVVQPKSSGATSRTVSANCQRWPARSSTVQSRSPYSRSVGGSSTRAPCARARSN